MYLVPKLESKIAAKLLRIWLQAALFAIASFAIQAQTMQGSFTSTFKGYLMGEAHIGQIQLAENQPAWTAWSAQYFAMTRSYYKLLAGAGQKAITTHIKDQAQERPTLIKWILKTDGAWSSDFSAFTQYAGSLSALGIAWQINCLSPAGWNGDVIPFYEKATGTNKQFTAFNTPLTAIT